MRSREDENCDQQDKDRYHVLHAIDSALDDIGFTMKRILARLDAVESRLLSLEQKNADGATEKELALATKLVRRNTEQLKSFLKPL